MAQSINELERDIEESRARLDLTIDRIQDKLSVTGIVDDVLGQMRRNQYASVYDTALEVVRRNPVPVMLVAAGIGWLLYRASKERTAVRGVAYRPYDDAEMPVVSAGVRTGQTRVYSPDPVALDPLPGTLDGRRDGPLSGASADPLDTRRDPVVPLATTGLGPRM